MRDRERQIFTWFENLPQMSFHSPEERFKTENRERIYTSIVNMMHVQHYNKIKIGSIKEQLKKVGKHNQANVNGANSCNLMSQLNPHVNPENTATKHAFRHTYSTVKHIQRCLNALNQEVEQRQNKRLCWHKANLSIFKCGSAETKPDQSDSFITVYQLQNPRSTTAYVFLHTNSESTNTLP